MIFTDFFLPAFSALTFPDPDTVAYFVLLLVHFSFLLAPLDAVTLAFRLSVFPALTVFFPVILIFLTVPFMILILNVAFFPLPSVAYAVIVTVFPAAFLLNFTTPFLSTVAYFLLLVVHLIFLLLASFEILAVNFTFFPAESLLDGAVTVILATFCGASGVGCVGFCDSFTLTLQYALYPLLPSAVITAVPALLAVILPASSTDTTELSDDIHLIFLSVAVSG